MVSMRDGRHLDPLDGIHSFCIPCRRGKGENLPFSGTSFVIFYEKTVDRALGGAITSFLLYEVAAKRLDLHLGKAPVAHHLFSAMHPNNALSRNRGRGAARRCKRLIVEVRSEE
jgi:hypothetical protein